MATATPQPPDIAPEPSAGGDSLYEVVAGRFVEKPPMGAYEGEIASLLLEFLAPFVRAHRLGKVVAEVLFRIDPAANLQRRPDVAFISDARWPRNRRAPEDAAWDVIPDLAIEVVSPTNTAGEVVARVREYFQAGVRRIWVVYPSERLVYVHETSRAISVLHVGDELDGGDLLPGFRLPLATLFEGEAE